MRAIAVMAMLASGCGHPQSPPPPEPDRGPPTPVPVDAPVAVAAPPDAAPPDAAPPDAAPAAACWEPDPSSGRIVQVLRVRVTATGDDGVARGKETWASLWAEAEIVEVISGDMTEVDKRFRTSVYAITETHYCKKGLGCGERPPDGEVEALIAAKGEERVVVIALPPQGSDWKGIPGRLRKKYGKLQPELLKVCPVP